MWNFWPASFPLLGLHPFSHSYLPNLSQLPFAELLWLHVWSVYNSGSADIYMVRYFFQKSLCKWFKFHSQHYQLFISLLQPWSLSSNSLFALPSLMKCYNETRSNTATCFAVCSGPNNRVCWLDYYTIIHS